MLYNGFIVGKTARKRVGSVNGGWMLMGVVAKLTRPNHTGVLKLPVGLYLSAFKTGRGNVIFGKRLF